MRWELERSFNGQLCQKHSFQKLLKSDDSFFKLQSIMLRNVLLVHRVVERETRDSAICPHCHSADETVEHLVFQCPAHCHARRDSWPGDTFTTDPRRLWSYLERIGAVTPPDGE